MDEIFEFVVSWQILFFHGRDCLVSPGITEQWTKILAESLLPNIQVRYFIKHVYLRHFRVNGPPVQPPITGGLLAVPEIYLKLKKRGKKILNMTYLKPSHQ